MHVDLVSLKWIFKKTLKSDLCSSKAQVCSAAALALGTARFGQAADVPEMDSVDQS